MPIQTTELVDGPAGTPVARLTIRAQKSGIVELVMNWLAGPAIRRKGHFGFCNKFQYGRHLTVSESDEQVDVILDGFAENGLQRLVDVRLQIQLVRQKGLRNKSNHIQLLDTVRSTDKLADQFRDLPVRVQIAAAGIAGCVYDRQRTRNPESFGMVNLVDGNAVHLGRPFLDQLEPEIVLPLDVADVIEHGVDQRRLA